MTQVLGTLTSSTVLDPRPTLGHRVEPRYSFGRSRKENTSLEHPRPSACSRIHARAALQTAQRSITSCVVQRHSESFSAFPPLPYILLHAARVPRERLEISRDYQAHFFGTRSQEGPCPTLQARVAYGIFSRS